MRRSPLIASLCATLAFLLSSPAPQALAAGAGAERASAGSSRVIKAKASKNTSKIRKAKPSKRRSKAAPKRALSRAAMIYAPLSAGAAMGLGRIKDALGLSSNAALVVDASSGEGLSLFEKNAEARLPIASITKLMSAVVAIEAQPDMGQMLSITEDDVDRVKMSSSRLPVGTRMIRSDMLQLALMSSENRAAHALSRHYPGGTAGFVAAMNAKARELGMMDTRYVDPTGLSPQNVSTARDLAKLMIAAQGNETIRSYSTHPGRSVAIGSRSLNYLNTNRLVRDSSSGWQIGLQKTGYIMEAGRCLVMQAVIGGRPIVMVFLDSKGQRDRFDDASRVRRWLAARSVSGGLASLSVKAP